MANVTPDERNAAKPAAKRGRGSRTYTSQKLKKLTKDTTVVHVTMRGRKRRSIADLKNYVSVVEPAATPSQSAVADVIAERQRLVPVTFMSGVKVTGDKLSKSLSDLAIASTDILGNSEQALRWLNEHPVPALSGKTAASLIADGWGNAVVRYLDELRYGSRG